MLALEAAGYHVNQSEPVELILIGLILEMQKAISTHEKQIFFWWSRNMSAGS